MSRSFEDFDSQEPNLIVSICFIGKVSPDTNTRYKVVIEDKVKALNHNGIKMIEAKKFRQKMLANLDWNLSGLIKKNSYIPTSNSMFVNLDSSVNLRFGNYEYKNHSGSANSEKSD